MSSIVSARRAPFPRSNVHLGHSESGSTNVGSIRPISFFPVVPGDDVFFAGHGAIRPLQIKLPYFGKMVAKVDYFFIPYKLYVRSLRDNNVSTFNPDSVVFPQLGFPAIPFNYLSTINTLEVNTSGSTTRRGLNPRFLRSMANSGADFSYRALLSANYRLYYSTPSTNADFPLPWSSSLTVPDDTHRSLPVVESGSLLNAIGFPVGYMGSHTSSASPVTSVPEKYAALRAIGYIDTIRNYYVNLQVPLIPLACESLFFQRNVAPGGNLVADASDFKMSGAPARFGIPCEALDKFIEDAYNFGTSGITTTGGSANTTLSSSLFISPSMDLLPGWRGLTYSPLRRLENYCTRDGLIFVRSFSPVYEESWISKTKYDTGPGSVTVQIEDDQVLLTSIRSGSKILKFKELSVAGGYRYDDFLSVQFDVKSTADATIPVYLGSSRGNVVADPIYQLAPGESEAAGVGDGIGAIGGAAYGEVDISPRRWTFHEFGDVMVVLSIVPDVSYFSQIDPFLEKVTLNTLYYPSLDRLGFQPLMARNAVGCTTSILGVLSSAPSSTEPTAWFDFSLNTEGKPEPNSTPDRYSLALGYQPAWSEYTRLSDRISGDLTGPLRPWTFSRSLGDQVLPAVEPSDRFLEFFALEAPTLEASMFKVTPFIQSVTTGGLAIARSYSKPQSVFDTYIRPSQFNYLFEDTLPSAHNFLYEFTFVCDIRREKSKLNMPTFGL